MAIEQTLHNELLVLYQECKQLIYNLENSFPFKNQYCKERIEENTMILKQICSQLEIHLKIDDVTITSVDFYSNFQAQFNLNRYQKSVEYYIQEGYGNNPELVTDSEKLKQEFTINNCMNSMHLVPINLASNAMKYMLSGQQAKVVLLKTPRRNIITVTNLGPKNSETNLENLTKEGYRGDNSSKMAGMGLGLSQIKAIIGLHKTLLDASIDISQDNKNIVMVDGKEYTTFSVTISYLRSVPEQSISPSTTEFFNRIPLIIAHNMVDIIANLFSVVDKLPRLPFKNDDERFKRDFLMMIGRFQLTVEKMQETIKLCLYIRNNYSTQNIMGNICPIEIGCFFKKEIEQLYIHRYSHVERPVVRGTSQIIDTFSAVYPVIYGLCDLILSHSSKVTELDIDIDNSNISITSNNINFEELLYDGYLNEEPELEKDTNIKSCMYIDILEECNIKLEKNQNQLIINYEYAKCE